MPTPRERQLELRLTNLMLACGNALRDWSQLKPRAALRGTLEETRRWLREDAARPAAPPAPPEPERKIGGRLPYSEDD